MWAKLFEKSLRGQPVVGGPFSYKQMMEPRCLEDTNHGLVSGALGGGLNVNTRSLVSKDCLIPGTDAFPFHYQKPLRRPLDLKDVWFQFLFIITSAKDTFTSR